MLARIRDWHQSVSWNAGYVQGAQQQPFRCPWWADRMIFGVAYMQGMTGDQLITTEVVQAERRRAAKAGDILNKLRIKH
jgi:hypothetical protein